MKTRTKIFIIFMIFLLAIGNYYTYIEFIRYSDMELPDLILFLFIVNGSIISIPSAIYSMITEYIEEERRKTKIIELVKKMETNHLEERELLLSIIEKQQKKLEKYKKSNKPKTSKKRVSPIIYNNGNRIITKKNN